MLLLYRNGWPICVKRRIESIVVKCYYDHEQSFAHEKQTLEDIKQTDCAENGVNEMNNNSGNDKTMTIHDVARELGVSASTVSRAISGKGRIGAATRDRILAYIEEHGFYPNAAAQSLAQSRTNNIAIILPEVNTLVDMPFFHTCMYGVEEVAQANDYDIIVVTTNGNDTKPLERLIKTVKWTE